MSGWFQEKSGEVQAKADEATKIASETGQSIQDRAVESKDHTGGFLGEKTEDSKKAAVETADAAKQKANETAQYVQGRAADAVQHTEASAAADKETSGNVFQQAGGQVMGAAVGAKDAVMNTLGMGGDAATEKK